MQSSQSSARPHFKAWNTRSLGGSDLKGQGHGGQVVVQRRGKQYLAFIGHMDSLGTSIVDVTSPEKPEVLAQTSVPANTHAHKVRVAGDVMLVNNERYNATGPHEAGLRLYDVKDPTAPKELSFFKTGGAGVHRFWVDGTKKLAYISTELAGFISYIFMVVDISNPRNPTEVSRWWIPGQNVGAGEKPDWNQEQKEVRVHHPIVLGDYAYVSYWDAGFVILDISDVKRPRFVSRRDYYPPYGGATHTALPISRKLLDRDWMVLCDEAMPKRKGKKMLLWMIDVTEKTNPVSVATFDVPPDDFRGMGGVTGPHQPYEDVDAKDDLLYVAWRNAGLRVVNISNPYRPVEVGHYVPTVPEGAKAITTNDVCVDDRGLIYTIDRFARGLDIIEYTGPR